MKWIDSALIERCRQSYLRMVLLKKSEREVIWRLRLCWWGSRQLLLHFLNLFFGRSFFLPCLFCLLPLLLMAVMSLATEDG